jgi:hypothetical protein
VSIARGPIIRFPAPTPLTCDNRPVRSWRIGQLLGSALVVGVASLVIPATGAAATAPAATTTVVPAATGGPASRFDCVFNVNTDAFTGAYGSASAIGWLGNQQGVVTCLGGTFVVQDGIYRDYGFGIYNGSRTTWSDVDGYLPAQVTTFRRPGVVVAITEFADQVSIAGDAYVAVYCRVAVRNVTDHPVVADPEASAGLVPLNAAPDPVEPRSTVDHDYVVAADRFGNAYPWPTTAELAAAGGFDAHLAHMEQFWNTQLAAITQISVPDRSLVDAYRSGFITTQIARSGDELHTGVNGYESEYSHDVIGILTNLFTQGYFTDAPQLLLEARDVMGSAGQYDDGLWLYSLPWAIYLMKTGDVNLVEQNFATEGSAGSSQPSIEDAAHAIAADRTGPGGIMESTDDIDFQGYWTTDDYEALLGLAAYHYLAAAIGDSSEATWANDEYDSLLDAVNATLSATIRHDHLDYLPCSMVQPNTANTCAKPEDANWTSPFGRWAWDGSLLGAHLDGPGASLISATYAYGFKRLKGKLPPDTFGGFPDDYYSTAYNAGQGSAGLATESYRDQGILSYQFMIANGQSGPNSWWESSGPPSSTTPWVGRHPTAGQGSSPHAWGMAQANNVLLDSLVAVRSDGAAGGLIVGRGVPAGWLARNGSLSVSNFPTTDGGRMNLTVSWHGTAVSLTMSGHLPGGQTLVQLPAFIDNIARTSSGAIDESTGTVTLSGNRRTVSVQLRRPEGSG